MEMRIFAMLLALLLTFSLFSCTENDPDRGSQSTDEVGSGEESSSASQEEDEEPNVLSAETLEDFKYTEDDAGNITLTGVKEKKIVSCTIPEGVVAIASGTFQGCGALESITFHEALSSIGLGAFSDCVKLLETVNGVSYVGTWAVDCKEEVTTVSLREGTVGIGDSVFAGCTKLERVTIPASVLHIGTYAFSRCEALKSLSLPKNLATVGGYAFFSCLALEELVIPSGVRKIEEYALGQCTALESVTLPSTLLEIGEGAFYDCSSLSSVSYEGDAGAWDEIVMAIGNEALISAYEKD